MISKKFICTAILLTIIMPLASCNSDSSDRTTMENSTWVCIPDTNQLEVNTINGQVTYRTGRTKSGVAVTLYYKNYVLYYDMDTDTFYYYDHDDNVQTVTRDEIMDRPAIKEIKETG